MVLPYREQTAAVKLSDSYQMHDVVDSRLFDILACPRDHAKLRIEGSHLCCSTGHRYPVVDGIPVFLLAEWPQTIGIASASLHAAESGTGEPLYLETLGLSAEEKRGIEKDWTAAAEIDAAISYLIGATSGRAYVDLIGKLNSYPIPDIPLEESDGELLLDVGSNWGRWSVSAARKGWRVIAMDPSLGAVMASRRAFRAEGLDLAYVCGDARFLPFKAGRFRSVYSYSVLQHFSEADTRLALTEVGRILQRGGFAKIQMANKGGIRSTYNRIRLRHQAADPFRVRYWSVSSILNAFEKTIGPSEICAEGFGGLGLLSEDSKYVSAWARFLTAISVFLKKLSLSVRPLIWLADSVYVISVRSQ
jgi:uncharacterized protein YbaR (Trm112 family)/SAM-dependent methyltransferase